MPSISPIFVSAIVREQIESQLFRLMGKRDPRAIPRIIKERVRVPEAVVDHVIQGIVREYRAWQREIRSAIGRADAAAAAVWTRRSA